MKKDSKASAGALLASVLLAWGLNAAADPVGSFTWRNDPLSDPDTSQISAVRSGNTVTFNNFQAVNKTNQDIADMAVVVPWVFSRIGTTVYSLGWSNTQNGWVNQNVDGSSLLVTLDNVSARLAFGELANQSGLAPLSATKSYQNVKETRLASDEIPFLDLGDFGAKEAKAFSLSFTYHFGDQRQLNGAAPFTIGSMNTVVPVAGEGPLSLASMAESSLAASVPVPEPGSLALLGLALLMLMVQRSRSGASPISSYLPRQRDTGFSAG